MQKKRKKTVLIFAIVMSILLIFFEKPQNQNILKIEEEITEEEFKIIDEAHLGDEGENLKKIFNKNYNRYISCYMKSANPCLEKSMKDLCAKCTEAAKSKKKRRNEILKELLNIIDNVSKVDKSKIGFTKKAKKYYVARSEVISKAKEILKDKQRIYDNAFYEDKNGAVI